MISFFRPAGRICVDTRDRTCTGWNDIQLSESTKTEYVDAVVDWILEGIASFKAFHRNFIG